MKQLPFMLGIFILAVGSVDQSILWSRPCYPSDPTGNNVGNLCPTFPPPGIRSDSFVKGEARPIRELPTQKHPDGRSIIRVRGYWEGSYTSGTSRTINTNRGETFRVKK